MVETRTTVPQTADQRASGSVDSLEERSIPSLLVELIEAQAHQQLDSPSSIQAKVLQSSTAQTGHSIVHWSPGPRFELEVHHQSLGARKAARSEVTKPVRPAMLKDCSIPSLLVASKA